MSKREFQDLPVVRKLRDNEVRKMSDSETKRWRDYKDKVVDERVRHNQLRYKQTLKDKEIRRKYW